MTFAARFWPGSLASAGTGGIALFQQSKSLLAESIRELELKLANATWIPRNELCYAIILKQIRRVLPIGFSSRKKIMYFERSCPTYRSKIEQRKTCTNDLSNPSHDGNQIIEAHNENQAKVDLRLSTVADRLRIVEASMASV